MKTILSKLSVLIMFVAIATGCVDDDTKFGDINAPSGLTMDYTIQGKDDANPNGDGTGYVELRAHAENAISYKYILPGGVEKTVAGGVYLHRFTMTGVNDYEVTVIAYGKAGVASSATFMVEDVLSNFDDPVTTTFLTGSGTKVWYWSAAEQGHLGVGPNAAGDANNHWASYYMAGPFEKAGSPASSCLYTNKLTFTLDGTVIKYTLENEGTFFNGSYTSVGGGNQTDDTCLPFDVSGQKIVSLEPASSFVAAQYTTGTQMNFNNNGFMGYYIGQNVYEIMEISDNRMVVRAVQANNPALAWYHIFTTQDPSAPPTTGYDNLIWEDDFNTDGAPNPANWTMEVGNGQNGWGNNEQQYYRAENAVVSGGSLVITAKKEPFNGFQYTSARMMSHNKFDFTYGKVEIRAKLTTGNGTWPALWMLGSNFQTTAWPACGEIDMMEYAPNLGVSTIHGTLHYPGNFGGSANTTTTTLANPAEWHTYTLIWSPEAITWAIDDNPAYKTFINGAQHPYFNWNYFLILNVAMGGNMGGTIDPAFTQSTMEVDYIRVYQ